MSSKWYWGGANQHFSRKISALMAILSEATPGHHYIPRDLIIDAKNERIANPLETSEIQLKDAKKAIYHLYRLAGAIGSEWAETKDKKKTERHDTKKERSKGKGRMAEALDEEMEELSGRLDQASMPNTMAADDLLDLS